MKQIDKESRESSDLKRTEREEAEKRRIENERLDIEALIKMPQFQRYMKRIFKSGGIMRSVFTGNSQTFYNSGKQDFATEIWTTLALINNRDAVEMLLPDNDKDQQND